MVFQGKHELEHSFALGVDLYKDYIADVQAFPAWGSQDELLVGETADCHYCIVRIEFSIRRNVHSWKTRKLRQTNRDAEGLYVTLVQRHIQLVVSLT